MKRRTLHAAALSIVVGAPVLVAAYTNFAPDVCTRLGTTCVAQPEITAAILAAGGGLLAIMFQWRGEFVATLREVWRTCLEGYAEVRSLYRLDTVTDADVQRALRAMSLAIDSMRSIYRNVGEDETYIGLYPYTPLHDIRLIVQADHKSGAIADPDKSRRRIAELDAYWRTFRIHFLDELRPPEPDSYVTDRLRSDTRKPGLSLTNRIFRTGKLRPDRLLTDEDLLI